MLKKTIFLLLVLSITGVAAVPAARRISWDPKKRPRMELPQAIKVAHEFLNKHEQLPADDDRFYCLSALLAITTSHDGDWSIRFGSKENGERTVIVNLDGVCQIATGYMFY